MQLNVKFCQKLTDKILQEYKIVQYRKLNYPYNLFTWNVNSTFYEHVISKMWFEVQKGENKCKT